jgi:hypothetical protein
MFQLAEYGAALSINIQEAMRNDAKTHDRQIVHVPIKMDTIPIPPSTEVDYATNDHALD